MPLYIRHVFWLTYTNPEVEARYRNAVYTENNLYYERIVLFMLFVLIPLVRVLALIIDGSDETFSISLRILFVERLWISLTFLCAVVCLLLHLLPLTSRRRIRPDVLALAVIVCGAIYSTCETFHVSPSRLTSVNLAYYSAGLFTTGLIGRVPFRWYFPSVALSCTATYIIIVVIASSDDSNDNDWDWLEVLWLLSATVPIATMHAFEVQRRLSFERTDRSTRALRHLQANIDKLQSVLVDFFPPTPASHLLAPIASTPVSLEGGNSAALPPPPPPCRRYPGTVLIVSHAVGFSSWVKRSDFRTVVAMLNDMMVKLDAAAAPHHVERVATVGDVYIGAIFGTDAVASTPQNCAFGIQFAARALNDGGAALPQSNALRLRCGVHLGNVDAVYCDVGRVPRLVIVGSSIDEARVIEATGMPGQVHVSAPAANSASEVGDPIDGEWILDEAEQRASLLCMGWSPKEGTSVLTTTSEGNASSTTSAGEAMLAHSKADISEMIIRRVIHDEVGYAAVHSTENVEDMYRLHPLLLNFVSPQAEVEYLDAVQRHAVHRYILYWFTLSQVFQILFCIAFLCLENTLTVARVLVLCLLASVFVQLNYHRSEFGAGYSFRVVCACYLVPCLLSTFVDTHCDEQHPDYDDGLHLAFLRSISTDLLLSLWYGIMFCLDKSFRVRLTTMIVLFSVHIVSLTFRYIFIDGEMWRSLTINVLFPITVVISYFLEREIRLGFTSQRKGVLALHSTSSYAQITKRALNVMLPPFVLQQAVAGRRAKIDTIAKYSYTGSAAVLQLSLFLDNMCNDDDGWGDGIEFFKDVIGAVDLICGALGATLVRVTNTTLVCVAGISDNSTQTLDAVHSTHIIYGVMHELRKPGGVLNSAGALGRYRGGIHHGACYGAVVRSKGVAFDLFGECVTVTHCLERAAEPGEVLISVTCASMINGLDGASGELRAVDLEGLGTVNAVVL
eukprot:PhM_4_TR6760/c0_g1_i1/m.39039